MRSLSLATGVSHAGYLQALHLLALDPVGFFLVDLAKLAAPPQMLHTPVQGGLRFTPA